MYDINESIPARYSSRLTLKYLFKMLTLQIVIAIAIVIVIGAAIHIHIPIYAYLCINNMRTLCAAHRELLGPPACVLFFPIPEPTSTCRIPFFRMELKRSFKQLICAGCSFDLYSQHLQYIHVFKSSFWRQRKRETSFISRTHHFGWYMLICERKELIKR